MSDPTFPTSCYFIQYPGLGPLIDEIRTWSVILEMGPGSFGALWHHIDPRMIDVLVLSHTHANHMGSITSLQVFRRWEPGSNLESLSPVGPAGTLERIYQIDEARLPDTYKGEFDIRTVRMGQSYRIGPMALTPFPGIHAVESPGARTVGPSDSPPSKAVSMLFTGDTDEAPVILERARGVDLLLTEVGFTHAGTACDIRMDGMRAGRLTARTKVARLVATHIQPQTGLKVVESGLCEHWAGPLNSAVPRRVFTVGQ